MCVDLMEQMMSDRQENGKNMKLKKRNDFENSS